MAGAGWFGIGWEWWILYGEIFLVGTGIYSAINEANQKLYTTVCAGCDVVAESVQNLEYAVRETSRG